MAAEASTVSSFDDCVPDAEEVLGRDDLEEAEHPSMIAHLVKSLIPGQDLTRVMIPSFFLETRSLLEKMADSFMHPQLIIDITTLDDPLERMIHMVRWYVSGYHYKTAGVKKPYNPIIGETFACCWKHEDGSHSQFFAEQVTHRPPVCALYFENRKHNLVMNAQIWTKSQFSAPQTAKSILEGGSYVYLTDRDEKYFATFPSYFVHNLLLGTLRAEVGGKCTIICEKSDLRADLEFTMKPMWGGADKINGVTATISRISTGEKLATIDGHWDTQLFVQRTGGDRELLLDIPSTPIMPKYVLPVERQGQWESRNLWKNVTTILRERPHVNWDAADAEKGKLEDAQRTLPCHRATNKQPWPTKKFHERTHTNPLTGKEEHMYFFDDMRTTPYEEGEEELNLIEVSRSCNDPRNEEGIIPEEQ